MSKREDVAAALARRVTANLHKASAQIRGSKRSGKIIHGVRRKLRRARSILKVLEHGSVEGAAAIRNELAETARLLAGARDAAVVATAARQASDSLTSSEPEFTRLVDALERDAAAQQRNSPLEDVGRRLEAAADAVSGLNTDFDGEAILEVALNKAYRDALQSMECALVSLATPDLHRWRKKIKRLENLVGLSRLPRRRKVKKRLAELGELLGLDHDLALLVAKLELQEEASETIAIPLALIQQRRQALESEAGRRGRRTLKKKPKAFVRGDSGD